ncbi:MAG: signal peptide peptidase SppA [Planctomycetes bacterium]|nr:signal peptide peptidase SppA [Planctomycetota bacterium]MCB9890504.1 signal peptide peptidase SppA [Planctomycetota bacterium]MCB9917745.1 signal peptide peptidase SppA [Planctomycetota bacterium]
MTLWNPLAARVVAHAAILLSAALSTSAATQDKTGVVAPTKVSVVRFAGDYADLPSDGFDPAALLLGGGSGKQSSFYEMRARLEALACPTKEDTAATTPLFFDLTRAFSLNGAQLSELERSMQKIRKSGRETIAYVENANPVAYQIAALCDRVLIADMGSVDLRSPSLSITFMQDAMALLGVRMDVVRCGDFKGAVEPYVLPRMSEHLRNHYRTMIARINDDIVRRIAEARRLDPSKVRELQARRLLSAKDALEAGLVDRIVPYDGATHTIEREIGKSEIEEVEELKKDQKRQSLNFMAMFNSVFAPRSKREKKVEKDTIAILHLSGTIVDGNSDSGDSMVSGPTVSKIDELRDNEKVCGVVVRINSPGGSATASEAIRRALARLAETKPVVFSMGRLAASGGYWITCIERPIYAEATTITGSIGVFGMKPDVGPLMRRIGLHEEVVALDFGHELDSITNGWSEQTKARLQDRVDDVYDRFLDLASKSRHIARKDLDPLAGGRVWSGEQARDRGLIDEIGGIDSAIAKVAEEAKISEFETMHTPKAKGFFDAFVEQLFARTGLDREAIRLARKRLGAFDGAVRVLVDALEHEGSPRIWAITPADVRLR